MWSLWRGSVLAATGITFSRDEFFLKDLDGLVANIDLGVVFWKKWKVWVGLLLRPRSVYSW